MGVWTARGLAVLRIAFGLYFLISAYKKTTRDWFVDGGPVADFVQKNLPQAEAVYRPFLEGVVLPNADVFADMVALGEWAAGISLTLGLLTRVGALTSVLLTLNFILTKGLGNLVGGPTVSTDALFVAAGLACLIAPAGLVWGLDGAFRRTFAANPLTRWLAAIPRTRHVAVPTPGGRVVPLRTDRVRKAS